jgi:hypothetical protein
MNDTPTSAKTFRCLVLAYRWSFETDADIIISPTGTSVAVPAHHYRLNGFPQAEILNDVIRRSHTATERQKHGTQEFAVMHLTAAEMLAFLECYNHVTSDPAQVLNVPSRASRRSYR